MRTRPTFSNCYFGLLYLMLRGTAKRVIFAPGEHWPYLPHAGALTARGHYVSFYRLLPHEQNAFAPWWFAGSFRGVRSSRWPKWIAQRGRYRTLELRLALTLWLIGYAVLFIPWVAAWSAFGPVWTVMWAYLAIRRRGWLRKSHSRQRRNELKLRAPNLFNR